MDIRKDILWRAYAMYIILIALAVGILFKIIHLQYVQGEKWKKLGKDLYESMERRPAERGTIYSDNMEMLSSSIPFFDIHMDFRPEGLRKNKGAEFFNKLDSLCGALSSLFGDKTPAEYREALVAAYERQDPYFEIKKKLTYQQYFKLRNFPFFNKNNKNKTGLIVDVREERLNPFGLMANRTIGLSRTNAENVGLEKYYDNELKGQQGQRLVQTIAGGVRIPINGTDIEPVNGYDIVTTLNVQMQDIAQNALLKMMQQNEALTGTAIVMEVSTGKIKAIANLGRQNDGKYFEDNNYAIVPSEPGSTIKLITLMSALDDGLVSLTDRVSVNGGYWHYNGRDIRDEESFGGNEINYKDAFVHSSNVAMAKLAVNNYSKNPKKYIQHYIDLRLDKTSGIDLVEPFKPYIKVPNKGDWSMQTLASMGFGYELRISPLQTLMIYNAIANNGRMMKPYLVTDIKSGNNIIKHIEPTVYDEAICKNKTVVQLKEALVGVCKYGTAKDVFNSTNYSVGGKTGTTKVDDGKYNYDDKVYQSSFVGYFPAENPRYSCIVLIKNKPNAANYLGGKVAAPVFKEIADQIVVMTNGEYARQNVMLTKTNTASSYNVNKQDAINFDKSMRMLKTQPQSTWGIYTSNKGTWSVQNNNITPKQVPNVIGMGLRSALVALENKGIKVEFIGKGRVVKQSVPAGTSTENVKEIKLELK